jgi:hypothetical protein
MYPLISRRLPGAMLVLAVAALTGALAGCDDPVESSDLGIGTTVASGEAVDLSGAWTLNAEESDLPRDHMGRRHDGPPRPRGRRGFGGGLHEHLHEGEPPPEPRPEGAHELVIAQDETTLTITHGDAFTVTLYTDGRVVTEELPRGGVLETRAVWGEGALVVERTLDNGGLMITTYELSEDGQQLFVTTVMNPGRRDEPLDFRRVYDAA